MAKRWQTVEINYLKKYSGKKSLADLAARFKTTEAEVKAKLEELDPSGPEDETELLARFEAGMKALQGQKWAEAAKAFEKAIEAGDSGPIVARSRAYLAVARRNQQEAAEVDPYLEAVAAKNRGDLARGLELATAGKRADKDERFAYLAASIHACREEWSAAAEHLAKAFELNPRNRHHASQDADFAAMRKEEPYSKLFLES